MISDSAGHTEPDALALPASEARERLRARARLVRAEARRITTEHVKVRARFQDLLLGQAELREQAQSARKVRDAIAEYSVLLRHLGTTPEQTVVDVKEIVQEATAGEHRQLGLITPEVVSWAIEAYFRQ